MIAGAEDVKALRKAGKIAWTVIEELKVRARVPGVSTAELDDIARAMILKMGAYPAFKDYKGFPGNICVSINETVVHGIPSDRIIREGDIVSLDIGVKFREYFSDAATTVGAGKISDTASRLIDVTEEALSIGIGLAVSGRHLSDMSAAIQAHVESSGFNVVRAFVGHGIGKKLHEDPEIPNYGRPGMGPVLKCGMALAIEPMVNAGTFEVEVLQDGWTAVTKDRKLSAHFEHTVLVGDRKAEVLTRL
ncbi:MAG: type I methionyl aminopeptidase [Candidatus Omnitrophica bacterium]|nr:type I methionyl aminopeptidase [Candidatus Omnitrophota bacterium]